MSLTVPDFKCILCDKVYNHHSNLRRHVRQCHGNCDSLVLPSLKSEPLQWFCCSSCPKKYRKKSTMRMHSVKEHGTPLHKRPRNPLHNCSLQCGFSSSDRAQIILHLKTNHDIDVETVTLTFRNYETFLSWKEETECETKSKFIVSAPKYASKLKTTYHFSCHRSGNYVSRGKGLMHLKKQGSNKINGFCPASMTVIVCKSSSSCEVEFVKTHVGHSNDLGHLFLSTKEREKLALKIAADIPFDVILEELQDVYTASGRIQLVTRKDLHNIKSAFKQGKLCPPIFLEKDDAASKIKAIQASHERSLLIAIENVVEEEGGWFVHTDVNCGELHTVQKAPGNCDGCHLQCIKCNTCIHMYTCTCSGYQTEWNMCEHIHVVSRYISSKNSGNNETHYENNCDFEGIVNSNCVVVIKDGTTEEFLATPSNYDNNKISPISLDDRKKWTLNYFQEILSSVVSVEEMDVIDEVLTKIKPSTSSICIVTSRDSMKISEL